MSFDTGAFALGQIVDNVGSAATGAKFNAFADVDSALRQNAEMLNSATGNAGNVSSELSSKFQPTTGAGSSQRLGNAFNFGTMPKPYEGASYTVQNTGGLQALLTRPTHKGIDFMAIARGQQMAKDADWQDLMRQDAYNTMQQQKQDAFDQRTAQEYMVGMMNNLHRLVNDGGMTKTDAMIEIRKMIMGDQRFQQLSLPQQERILNLLGQAELAQFNALKAANKWDEAKRIAQSGSIEYDPLPAMIANRDINGIAKASGFTVEYDKNGTVKSLRDDMTGRAVDPVEFMNLVTQHGIHGPRTALQRNYLEDRADARSDKQYKKALAQKAAEAQVSEDSKHRAFQRQIENLREFGVIPSKSGGIDAVSYKQLSEIRDKLVKAQQADPNNPVLTGQLAKFDNIIANLNSLIGNQQPTGFGLDGKTTPTGLFTGPTNTTTKTPAATPAATITANNSNESAFVDATNATDALKNSDVNKSKDEKAAGSTKKLANSDVAPKK